MIEMSFMRGNASRRIIVKDKSVTYLLAELGYQPYTIDLNKLSEHEGLMKKMKVNKKHLKEDLKDAKRLAKKGSEKEIAEDIKENLEKEGWRMVTWS